MDKKGFTLVELLAVIVILTLLALLTSTAVTKIVSDAKTDLSNTQTTLIKSATEAWMADNLNILSNGDGCSYLTIGDLKKYGLLDSDLSDPKTNQEISDDLNIKITTTISEYGKTIREVEVNPENVDSCKQLYGPICAAVDGTTQTFGNIPGDGFVAGDEYICTVSEGKDYHFFVLSTDGNKVNLIMDSNVDTSGNPIKSSDVTDKGLVEWVSKSDYVLAGGIILDGNQSHQGNTTKGPITAMKFLSQATSNWINLVNIRMNYMDERYGTIKTTGKTTKITANDGTLIPMTTYTDLKARLPMYDELSAIGCDSACPPWAKNYLWEYNSGASSGYWTLSSMSNYRAYSVKYSILDMTFAHSVGDSIGIRPVITVESDRFEKNQ